MKWVKQGVLVAGDVVLIGLSAWLSIALIGRDLPLAISLRSLWPLAAAGLIYGCTGALLGAYRRLWQYAGLRDMLAMLLACALGGSALLLPSALPLGLRALFWLLATGGLCGLRVLVRALEDRPGQGAALTRRVLVIGAGAAGTEVIRELRRHPELGVAVVGLLDDDPAKQGREACGVRVLGPSEEVARAVRDFAVSEVLIAIPSAPTEAIRRIWTAAAATGKAVRILPPLGSLDSEQRLVQQIRAVRLQDLLGRPEVQIDHAAVSQYIAGKVVLVTGAGGSIGSELCRQVAAFGPARLVLFGHGENSLYQIRTELSSLYPSLPLTTAVGDVQDLGAVARLFKQMRPHVVFHAAAHKHVPLMEENPAEAVKNNVLGTYHVALAAQRCGASRFVLISTDKAVKPSSIMGATKRAAERVTMAMAGQGPCRMIAVRFGNVLGSRGSVVPLFQQQIERGGPITVTHPDATRYFMTIPEAARLVIQAGAMGQSGELFVLDMGEPIRVLDLATTLARLARPDGEIPITFTGLRPGEKLTEELFDHGEVVSETPHPRIHRAVAASPADTDIDQLLEQLRLRIAEDKVTVSTILAAMGEETDGGDGLDGGDYESARSTHAAY